MASATAHPNHQLFSSEDVEGTGRVTYAVMSFGGFLGLGHSHYPLPWGALKYNPRRNGFETGVSETQLRDAPAFSDDSWSDRMCEKKTHTHYKVAPYW